MTLIPIEELFPGGWDVIATRVEALRRNLWGTPPDIPAVSIATLPIPDATVAKIRAKNLPRVRDELTIEEMNADTSPFRTHAYFDDQMLEVICARPGIWPNCRSSGVATDEAIVWGSAPGSCAVT